MRTEREKRMPGGGDNRSECSDVSLSTPLRYKPRVEKCVQRLGVVWWTVTWV